MRTWNRVLVAAGFVTASVVGCAVDGLSDQEEKDALSRLACESLTTEPSEIEECGDVAPDADVAELVSRVGEDAGLHRCTTLHPTIARRYEIEQEVEQHYAGFAPGKSGVTGGNIPVYWHVITNTSGQGNVTDTQIANQIACSTRRTHRRAGRSASRARTSRRTTPGTRAAAAAARPR